MLVLCYFAVRRANDFQKPKLISPRISIIGRAQLDLCNLAPFRYAVLYIGGGRRYLYIEISNAPISFDVVRGNQSLQKTIRCVALLFKRPISRTAGLLF